MKGSIPELPDFLARARAAGYANVESGPVDATDEGRSRLRFSTGPWSYVDTYVGGDPFAGQELVSFAGRPVWTCLYYGWAALDVDAGAVFSVLRNALRQGSAVPHGRGPASVVLDGLTYTSSFEGEVERFTGEEAMTDPAGREIYRALFVGGVVDQRRGI